MTDPADFDRLREHLRRADMLRFDVTVGLLLGVLLILAIVAGTR